APRPSTLQFSLSYNVFRTMSFSVFNFTGVSYFSMSYLFEEVEGFGLGFWTKNHLRKMMSLRRSSKQLAVFGNSTILDHSPY
ncbi:unnamed protein product, partial [Prunus brigantina]